MFHAAADVILFTLASSSSIAIVPKNGDKNLAPMRQRNETISHPSTNDPIPQRRVLVECRVTVREEKNNRWLERFTV